MIAAIRVIRGSGVSGGTQAVVKAQWSRWILPMVAPTPYIQDASARPLADTILKCMTRKLFMTACDEPAARARSERAGAVAYLTKPFPGKSLVKAVNAGRPETP
jgi:hypothetical protein